MKQLLISALVLAALGGAIWYSNKQEDAKQAKGSSKGPQLFNLNEDDIRGIEITRKGDIPTVLKRDDAGKWTITAPEMMAADPQAVTAITTSVRNLPSDRVVDEKPSQLNAYGLQPPAVLLKLTMKDGKTHELRVGEQTPDKSGVYAMVDNDPKLYTVGAIALDNYGKSMMDLREKRLMSFSVDKVSKADLDVQGKPPVEFTRMDDQWQISKPKAFRADKLTVQELLNTVHEAQIDPSMDEKAAQAAYNSAKPFATVRLTGESGPQTLEVRQSGSDYYAKSSSVAGAWKVASTVGDGLNKKLDDFQNKKLFDFGFDDPTQIEIKQGSDTKVIAKAKGKDNASTWLSNGRTMDSVSVQNLIDKLRELSASRIEDVSAGAPDLEITVTSKEGKRVETVQFAPSGKDYIGKRAGEPELFRIDGAVISDLKGAITGVREAEPAKDSKKK